MNARDPHARYRRTEPSTHYFGQTEADSELGPPSTQWPGDDILSDRAEALEQQRQAQRSRRIVCTEEHVEGRTARRASGVDSSYPGSVEAPVEPMREPAGMDVDWIVVAIILALVVMLFGAYQTGVLPGDWIR